MTNRSKAKGSSFERLISDYWRDHWSEFIDRRVLSGGKDKGDLANVRVGGERLVVEIKNCRTMALGPWVNEAGREADNDEAIAGIVVHKRVGKGDPGEQYVTMTLADLLVILQTAEGR